MMWLVCAGQTQACPPGKCACVIKIRAMKMWHSGANSAVWSGEGNVLDEAVNVHACMHACMHAGCACKAQRIMAVLRYIYNFFEAFSLIDC